MIKEYLKNNLKKLFSLYKIFIVYYIRKIFLYKYIYFIVKLINKFVL